MVNHGRTPLEPGWRRERPNVLSRQVLYMAGLPLDANVLFMTVMATKRPFVGRG